MKLNQLTILMLLNFCICGGLVAQETETEASPKEFYIKVYANFLYFNSDYNPQHYDFQKSFFSILGLTPAFSFRDRESRKINEIEARFWYSNRDKIKEYEFGLRYELCWYLKKEIVSGLRFRFGPSARLYYYKSDVAFNPDYGVSTTSQNGGLEVALATHLEYQITKKLKVELTSSNFNINFGVDYIYLNNPQLTRNQNTLGGFDFAIFNQRILRLGLGYEL